jgi:hypothetical protein
MRTLRTIRLLALIAAIALTASPALAQRGDDANRASKNGKTEGTIDGIDVTLEYGRPKVNEREIWGGLVPYDAVWRTGANEATTISLSGDALVEGKPIAAGTYALVTVPGEESWQVVFNKMADMWGAFSYDEEQDVLRVSVKPVEHEHVEEMTFVIEDSDVVLQWEKLAVPFTISAGE